MRGKRRNRGTWFPVIGTDFGIEGQPDSTWFEAEGSFANNAGVGVSAQFDVGTTNPVYSSVLTLDDTPDVDNPDTGSSLRDFVEGQTYLLERVVGKCWTAIANNPQGSTARCIAAIGLAILPVEDDSQTVPSLPQTEFDPLAASNAYNPWIWRRTWLLSNNGSLDNTFYRFPNASAAYGSVLDGGHIDTKGAKRMIRREQRLFACFSAQVVERTFMSETSPTGIRFGMDVRIFGQMRRGRNKSTFK